MPSLKLHVTTVVPCVVIGKIVGVVPVIVPAQLSVVVGANGVAEHWSVTSARVGIIIAAGAEIVKFCVAVQPFASVTVTV